MALDPSIPGRVQAPAQTASPAAMLGDIMKLRQIDQEAQAAAEERAKKRQQEADVQDAFSRHTLADGSPDYDAAINVLSGKHPDLALDLRNKVTAARTSQADSLTKSTAAILAQYQAGAAIIGQMVEGGPEAHAALLPLLDRLSPDVAAAVQTYDPTRLAALQNLGRSQADLFKERMDALTAWRDGDTDGAFLRYLKTARNDEEYQNIRAQARSMGVPQAVVDSVPAQWSPEAIEQVGAMSLSAKEQADIANQEATREHQTATLDETKRHNEATEAVSRGHLSVAQQQEKRLRDRPATAADGGTDEVGLRQARMWRVQQLQELEKRRKGLAPDGDGGYFQDGPTTPMSDAEYQAEKQQIENHYRSLVGDAPIEAPPPPAAAGAATRRGPVTWSGDRSQMSVAPRGGSDRSQRPAAPRAQATQSSVAPRSQNTHVAVGSIVVRGGKRYRIDRVNSDGTVDATPLP